MEPLLEVKNLKTYFKINKEWVPAVEEVNFHIDQGETLGIVGESGCGKSVTSMSIMRLLQVKLRQMKSYFREKIFPKLQIRKWHRSEERALE